jgi:hypothetical protein
MLGCSAVASIPSERAFHAAADCFPLLSRERQAELEADIHDQGLLEAIVLHENKILDGRCRYLACKAAGIEPRFGRYNGHDPVGYLVSRNLQRRDLTTGQRAIIAARLADLRVGANQHSEGVPLGSASSLLNVGKRSVARAKTVLLHGDPRLIAAVETGELRISAAARLIKTSAKHSDRSRMPTQTEIDEASVTHEKRPPSQVESPQDNELLQETAKVALSYPAAYCTRRPSNLELCPGDADILSKLMTAWNNATELKLAFANAPPAIRRQFVVDVLWPACTSAD